MNRLYLKTKTIEKNWIKYISQKDKNGFYRCVYCGCKIKFQGSCDSCGRIEDESLGKVGGL